jgi:branched-chain amino acid aminotransferase
MIETQTIKVQKAAKSRLPEVNFQDLKFGREFADHMFVMEYRGGKWQEPVIKPFGNISISPATSVLHYGQSIFEGMKAFKNVQGRYGLFRPDKNIERFNRSAVRMCMPVVPEGIFMEALSELVRLDNSWIPAEDFSSLYLRPFMYAIDEYVGVKASDDYRFMIFTSPVGAYYAKPVRVKIEHHFTRAAHGGTGFAKAAGNYAGSLYPARLANQQGFDQLLWTDASEHAYIEESGTMNVMFIINGTLITPELSDTILDGVTRRSVLQIAKDWNIPVEERRIPVKEVVDAMRNGNLQEAFGCGTAATIAHIASIADGDDVFELPAVEQREVSNKLIKHFLDLRKFRAPDPHGWMVELT